ncbi:MAG: UTP--glucose-1-phosphate uridylyltransferase [Planctomycetaceae bacterium]|jgi:UDP-N-acetylglucosamine/UDP-N-acetylgalactosamine diphosphorylase|nr:UTP--glucose-1-phosphate uridylyltransferase [Planctomycetaceae bacterium]
MKTHLILASRSPRRRELLEEAGYVFCVMPASDAAEDAVHSGETPEEYVKRLAFQKAADVLDQLEKGTQAILIGCDTLVTVKGKIIGKPKDRDDARRILQELRGTTHEVLSGLCLWNTYEGIVAEGIDRTILQMDAISDAELEEYLNTEKWAGKAGAFGYQDGYDRLHIVSGSESNVVGLPMELLEHLIEDHFITPVISKKMKETLQTKLAASHQEHLLDHWDSLTELQQTLLRNQIDFVDFDQLAALYQNRDTVIDTEPLISRAEEPPFYVLGKEQNQIGRQTAIRAGEELLRSGKAAALVVAGGQGTRLGFEHPKGMYPIGAVNHTTLFQIHLEKIAARAKKYGKPFPLCVMTSPVTHQETVDFLEKHNRFGFPEDDLYIFPQGVMPAVSLADGKVLLSSPGEIAFTPDGHGGMLTAIENSGTLDRLAKRGIEQLFYFQIDNPLVDIGNEEFLGYHLLSGSELSSQAVRKQFPEERVGNIIRVDGRLHVIEYCDLPDDAAQIRKPDGTLAIWAGSIAVHIMNLAFLKKHAAMKDSLPFHIAKKKVPYVDRQGNLRKPPEPNAIKFERFIFDLLPAAENAIVVEVDARHHFAPLKNASGAATDTPESVKKQCRDFYVEWLNAVGVEVVPGVAVEISPLFANSPAELTGKVAPGTRITSDRYFA